MIQQRNKQMFVLNIAWLDHTPVTMRMIEQAPTTLYAAWPHPVRSAMLAASATDLSKARPSSLGKSTQVRNGQSMYTDVCKSLPL